MEEVDVSFCLAELLISTSLLDLPELQCPPLSNEVKVTYAYLLEESLG